MIPGFGPPQQPERGFPPGSGHGFPHGPGHGFPPGSERTFQRPEPTPSVFELLRDDRRLGRLRTARRRAVFRGTGAVAALYLLDALLANGAPDFMAEEVAGPLNIGLALGLLQCGTTAWVAWWYGHHARTFLDPEAERLRALFERQEADQW